MRGVLVLVFTVALTPALGVAPAIACSCAQLTPPQALEAAELAFVGTLGSTKVPRLDGFEAADVPPVHTFAVTKAHKGEVTATQAVLSAPETSTCSTPLDVGRTYMVFAALDHSAAYLTPRTAQLGVTMNCTGTYAVDPGLKPAISGGRPPAPDTAESLRTANLAAASDPDDRPVFGMVASGIILLGTLTVLILAYRRSRDR